MNLLIFRYSEVLANLNKSLANELNQPTSFPTARSNKKIQKPNKAPKPINLKKPSGMGYLERLGFFLNPVPGSQLTSKIHRTSFDACILYQALLITCYTGSADLMTLS